MKLFHPPNLFSTYVSNKQTKIVGAFSPNGHSDMLKSTKMFVFLTLMHRT